MARYDTTPNRQEIICDLCHASHNPIIQGFPYLYPNGKYKNKGSYYNNSRFIVGDYTVKRIDICVECLFKILNILQIPYSEFLDRYDKFITSDVLDTAIKKINNYYQGIMKNPDGLEKLLKENNDAT